MCLKNFNDNVERLEWQVFLSGSGKEKRLCVSTLCFFFHTLHAFLAAELQASVASSVQASVASSVQA